MEEGFDTSNLMSEVVRLGLLNTELADALRRIKNRIAQIPARLETDSEATKTK